MMYDDQTQDEAKKKVTRIQEFGRSEMERQRREREKKKKDEEDKKKQESAKPSPGLYDRLKKMIGYD